MVYHAKAQSTYKPPLIANENAFLGDVDSRYLLPVISYIDRTTANRISDSYNPDKPISAGFYRLEKGTPLTYEYSYDEMKIILEGEYEISDETGQKVTALPGDVFHFPKGSKITFTTPSYGLAFFVSERRMEGHEASVLGLESGLLTCVFLYQQTGQRAKGVL